MKTQRPRGRGSTNASSEKIYTDSNLRVGTTTSKQKIVGYMGRGPWEGKNSSRDNKMGRHSLVFAAWRSINASLHTHILYTRLPTLSQTIGLNLGTQIAKRCLLWTLGSSFLRLGNAQFSTTYYDNRSKSMSREKPPPHHHFVHPHTHSLRG